MKLHHHTAASAIIAAGLYAWFHSWALSVSCFLSGIFIDLDHILDVVREHGFSKIHHIFRICNNSQFTHIYLVWHGWEWVILAGIASWLSGWNPWITGLFIGMGHHIFLDSIYNANTFMSYFLIWRWRNNFEFDSVFPALTAIKYK